MARRLEDEVALVTGSTRGIGRGIAEMFAQEGARVIVTGRTVDLGRQVQHFIGRAGGEAIFIPMDVENETDVRTAVTEAVLHFGKLTVLVNNAGPTDLLRGGTDGFLTALTTERWERLLRSTLTSVFWASKYAVPEMIKAGHGSIVNISSLSALRGLAGIDAYTAGKGGIIALTRSIATEYGSKNIRCNAIVVGMVLKGNANDERLMRTLGRMQLTRPGHVEDIAYAATYLASEESGYVTGAVLPLDGGLTSSIRLDISEIMGKSESDSL